MFLGPWIRFFGELFVCFLGTVHGGAQIVQEKKKHESFPLSKDVFLVLFTDASVGRVLGGAARTTSDNNSRISSLTT